MTAEEATKQPIWHARCKAAMASALTAMVDRSLFFRRLYNRFFADFLLTVLLQNPAWYQTHGTVYLTGARVTAAGIARPVNTSINVVVFILLHFAGSGLVPDAWHHLPDRCAGHRRGRKQQGAHACGRQDGPIRKAGGCHRRAAHHVGGHQGARPCCFCRRKACFKYCSVQVGSSAQGWLFCSAPLCCRRLC